VFQLLEDPEATALRNNVGKKLVYELLTYIFDLDSDRPSV
jgi:hypothetical protein